MESLWIETTKDKIKLESLKRDETTEVCIIGGGLFGLTTAYYLSQNGFKVTVLEKDEIGKRASGNTTGKITSQHDLFYAHLIDDYGEEFAKKYLEANENAIKKVANPLTMEPTADIVVFIIFPAPFPRIPIPHLIAWSGSNCSWFTSCIIS